jgi:hypothetical protein
MFGEILRSFLALERERHASRAVWHARSTRTQCGMESAWIDYVEHFLVDAKGAKWSVPYIIRKKDKTVYFDHFLSLLEGQRGRTPCQAN